MAQGQHILRKNSKTGRALALTAFLACAFFAPASFAETSSNISPLALEQALSAKDPITLYTPHNKSGFNVSSSTYSGLASGVTTSDSVADVNNEQKLYALLIDGRYDFNHEEPLLTSSVRPYVSAGMGVATTAQAGNSSSLISSQSGNAVPLFRLGGGVAYRLDQRWNLSLNYEAGRAAPSGGDQVFTGRSQQPVDLQQLNLGMSFAF